LLDAGTLEKTLIVARVQHCGVGERELAKILFGDEALLNRLERFGYARPANFCSVEQAMLAR
jgi:hypothetical protein